MIDGAGGIGQATAVNHPQNGNGRRGHDRSPRVYLAGPDVFLPDAKAQGERKKDFCRAYGLEGLYPFDNEAPPGEGQDRRIYAANIAMIRAADAGIFNLTPFRGPSADPGTVFELGFMAALGKPVFGYTNHAGDLHRRIARLTQGPSGLWQDEDGLAVENFGNADNLMIDCCLAEAGYPIVRVEAGGRLDILDGFAACLDRARLALGR